MASLSIKELSKRNNFQTFVYRIGIGQGFYIKNTDILIKLNKSILNDINSLEDLVIYKKGNSIQLPTEDNNYIPLNMLYKDSDFSTRTQYSTAKQDERIEELSHLINQIKESSVLGYVPIKITNEVYKVVSVKSLNNKSKADFCLTTIDGIDIGFVSHKHGSSPKDFQQWSGTSKRFQSEIFDHKETQSFIKELTNIFNETLPPASTVARKIQDTRLKHVAVFGNDYGNDYSQDNVEAVMQGNLDLKPFEGYYMLTGSHYTIKNGEDPLYGYDPVFMAVHKKDRRDHWIKNCRLTINPIGSRKIKTFI